MRINQVKLRNYLSVTLTIIILSACGGENSGSSNGCDIDTKDSDKDGFLDRYDLEPNEPFENGKYMNLENVINSEGVKHILKIAKERDVTVKFQLGNKPPKIKGYYRSEKGGRVVYAKYALSGGRTTGAYLYPSESRRCMSNGFHLRALNDSISSGTTYTKIRGDGQYFSIYRLYSKTRGDGCTGYYVDIRSGKVAKESGDLKNYKVIGATLGFSESKAGACNGAHISEEVFYTEDKKKITDLDDLELMCVDEGKAYVPTETWKNKAKESCKCTADIEIECE